MHKDIICGIYCIENMITHKKYIGQSTDIKTRWRKHKVNLNKNIHHNEHLQKSWNYYGQENFNFTVLERCSEFELDDKEIYYIENYNTLDREYGYNMRQGGKDAPGKATEEIRQKISLGIKKSYDKELKEMRRKNAFEQWANPEIKNKIMGENNGMYGKTHTEEARQKISEAQKGHVAPFRNTTPVLCVELNKVFSCACEAAKELGLHNSILEVCYGNRHTCGGYHWKFATENNI